MSFLPEKYLLRGYRICCVVKGSKYGKYAFAPSALHLQHPLSRYVSSKKIYAKNDFPLWEFILEGEVSSYSQTGVGEQANQEIVHQ